ncbi:MAG: 16S rRNA (adenine(1518)-N(6)/adenine(1519)-N(6))-dimethyltransferase RsmA [Candidatus Omnitrophota bacterium]|nr:ribosomal RNA small subunit methyltransferase A [Candidatus Omnitrophota bacterium]MBU1929192.1 ribosomal RNA small subunit methyltransferase A [Candidatus Omnitrophota bacterium]MBU2035483.1 ribosomal RNA small subunit methyltransferase A [Candidatus Omnitrophota bacterium]MBU2221609.1 ribosomal RNA small subunit methyltransferase A [Candidatus Omnitrophota bacterium]MBU2258131.1 ribosomal RNA small subunit methyltransferase A [Candidatus Omnitrophota bacterium]
MKIRKRPLFFRPKKRFGQNFLVDQNIRRKIIASCAFSSSDIVLEIGAGKGEMTGLVAEKTASVYALEIDRDLYPQLKENLKNLSNVRLFNQDILKFDFQKHFGSAKSKIKAFGNIPYYITTPIIEYLLENRSKVDVVFLTVQKEFARRIVSLEGSKDYGSLSCFIQYFTCPKIVFMIKRSCFRPMPKVDSCLIRLDIRATPAVNVKNEEKLFTIIRAAFNQRRKTLRNSLENLATQDNLNIFFAEHNIDPNIRPQDLSLDSFASLSDFIPDF